MHRGLKTVRREKVRGTVNDVRLLKDAIINRTEEANKSCASDFHINKSKASYLCLMPHVIRYTECCLDSMRKEFLRPFLEDTFDDIV